MINDILRKPLVFAAGLMLALGPTTAQVSPDKVAFIPPKLAEPLPFKIGETLAYNVTFSKLIFSGTIGELTLTVSKPPISTKPEMIELKAEAISKGFFPALFGVKVRDSYISLVNQVDFGIHSSTKLLEEGKVRREQKTVVNREAGLVTYTDRDLVNLKLQPKTKEKPSPAWVQDLLSAIYFVRTRALNDGEVTPVPISDGGEIYNIEVIAGRREDIATRAGKFRTIQLNAKVFDGRYIKRTGEMLVWVTDDAARIPVRAKVKTSGATITVDLKRMP